MTDCLRSDIRDVLPDWVHGSLDREAAAEVASHLTTCAACASEVELLRSIRALAPAEPPIDVQRVAAAVVQRTNQAQRSGRGLTRWRTVLGGLAVAASVVFGALLIRSDEDTTISDPIAHIPVGPAPQALDPSAAPDDSLPGTEPAREDTVVRPPPAAVREPVLRLAESEVPVSGGLSDLRVDQLESLLRRLEDIEALPQTSPAPALITDLEVR